MWRPLGVLPAAIVLVVVLPATMLTGTHVAATPGPSADVTRGDYLVHHVAMCAQCHSQRTTIGTPAAPQITALLAGWTDESFVHFLTTGDPGNRPQPRPPMPPFRMNEADARAVVAYLKTLR